MTAEKPLWKDKNVYIIAILTFGFVFMVFFLITNGIGCIDSALQLGGALPMANATSSFNLCNGGLP